VTSPFLYRGVSRALFDATHGGLVPKIRFPFKVVLEGGATTYVDPQMGLSTTPHQDRAEYYALGGGMYKSGVVYVFDRAKLHEYAVTAYSLCRTEVHSWAVDDDEVILVCEGHRAIPAGLIARRYDHGT
jgi:hypothetical protein